MKTPISLRIDSDLLTEVKLLSEKENRTLSNTIETLLQLAIETKSKIKNK